MKKISEKVEVIATLSYVAVFAFISFVAVFSVGSV